MRRGEDRSRGADRQLLVQAWLLSLLQVATLTGKPFPVPTAFRHRAGFATLVMDWLRLLQPHPTPPNPSATAHRAIPTGKAEVTARSRAEVRSEALRPVLVGQICGDQRISPVLPGQLSHRQKSPPIAASTQNQRRLHPLDILAAHHLRPKAVQLLQHALCHTSRKLADHPPSQPTSHIHTAILP